MKLSKIFHGDRMNLAAGIFLGAMFGIAAGVLFGFEFAPLRPMDMKAGGSGKAESRPAEEAKTEVWTCSMHPKVRLDRPGKCPICGMELIPADSGGSGVLSLSESGMALAEVKTVKAEKRKVETSVNLVGKVVVDETRVHAVTAWVPGRIDRLYVDFTGTTVRKGDHLALLYSPELIAAQQEYLSVLESLGEVSGDQSPVVRRSSENSVRAARDKLLLLGMDEAWIRSLEKRGAPEDHALIRSEYDGLVLRKRVDIGDYVKTGETLFDVADLGQIYVHLLAYERDLAMLRYGQEVEVMAEALPGKIFLGRISLLNPVLDEKTRTLALRVVLQNPRLELRPGMFVRARVHVALDAKGEVVGEDYSSSFICSMHPEIIRKGPGDCPICGMQLVQGRELGLTPPLENGDPLTVPASAVLYTGKRSVVWVRLPGEEPKFVAKEVLLGPRAGDRVIILDGLMAGELVVTEGAFKLDSEAQLRALPAMMEPKEMKGHKEAPKDEAPKVVGRPLRPEERGPCIRVYLEAQDALFRDDKEGARKALARLAGMAEGSSAALALRKVGADSSLEDLRAAFRDLGNALLEQESELDGVLEGLVRAHCPMAFGGKGADWLQLGTKVKNPWYGTKMPSCGNVVRRYRAPEAAPGKKAPGKETPRKETPRKEAPRKEDPGKEDSGEAGRDAQALKLYLRTWRALSSDRKDEAETLLRLLADNLKGSLAAASLGKAFLGAPKGAVPKGVLLDAFRRLGLHLASRGAALAADIPGLVRAHCPMAFDGKGADWLQIGEGIRNPYYGSDMLGCGSVVERYGKKKGSDR